MVRTFTPEEKDFVASRTPLQQQMNGQLSALTGILGEHKSSLVSHLGGNDASCIRYGERMSESASLSDTVDAYKRGSIIGVLTPKELKEKLIELGSWMNQNQLASTSGFAHGAPIHERFSKVMQSLSTSGFFDQLAGHAAEIAAGRGGRA